jgi:hypothetical protein
VAERALVQAQALAQLLALELALVVVLIALRSRLVGARAEAPGRT